MDEGLTLVFLKTGLQTTIQDLGRMGWQHFGVPISGAMDMNSYRLANLMVGNPENSPCLEMCMIGAEIEFRGKGQIAITGADLDARLNGKVIPMYQTMEVFDGDKLAFPRCKSGCRCYLAVRGDWKVPQWLGSCSEVPYAGDLAGLPPPVRKGTQIEILYRSNILPRETKVSFEPENKDFVRIITGPEYHLFNAHSRKDLTSRNFTISNQSNRMGYRLEGSLHGFEPLSEMISSGMIPGTIQVTRSGLLVILMADAQTTGGYHRIAAVLKDDLHILAQKKPGEEVGFRLI